jgi:hypothetical protein
MAELILRWSKRLFLSQRRRCIRDSVVWLLTNALLVAGVVFAFELLVILLGLEDIFLPLTQETVSFLTRLFL